MEFKTIIYALASGILPALLWLWFWLKEDNLHPEPRSFIGITFLGGGLIVIIAMIIEKIVAGMDFDNTTLYILLATIEESIKFLLILVIVFNSKYVDEPIDIIIYSITVALGFAAIENTLFILSPLNDGDIAKGIITGNMRFIGATLVHIVSSASIGFMIGISFYKNIFIKIISTIIGVMLAITLHTAFNLSIINVTGTDTLKIFSWVWFAIVVLLILFEEIKTIRPKVQKIY